MALLAVERKCDARVALEVKASRGGGVRAVDQHGALAGRARVRHDIEPQGSFAIDTDTGGGRRGDELRPFILSADDDLFWCCAVGFALGLVTFATAGDGDQQEQGQAAHTQYYGLAAGKPP